MCLFSNPPYHAISQSLSVWIHTLFCCGGAVLAWIEQAGRKQRQKSQTRDECLRQLANSSIEMMKGMNDKTIQLYCLLSSSRTLFFKHCCPILNVVELLCSPVYPEKKLSFTIIYFFGIFRFPTPFVRFSLWSRPAGRWSAFFACTIPWIERSANEMGFDFHVKSSGESAGSS